MFKAIFVLAVMLQIAVAGKGQYLQRPDTTNDYFLINYPLEKGPLYHVGDTIETTYSGPRGFFRHVNYTWFSGAFPHKPEASYKVRAIVTHVIVNDDSLYHWPVIYPDTLIASVILVERISGSKTEIMDSLFWDGEEFTPGKPIVFTDKYYGHPFNLSGLYKIQKPTDNFSIGDTIVDRHCAKALLLSTMGLHPDRCYDITAVVRDIDSLGGQKIFIQILDIQHWKKGTEIAVDRASYYGQVLNVREFAWCDAYSWHKPWQHIFILKRYNTARY